MATHSSMIPDGVDRQPYAWLTTIGRRSGAERTVELWFGIGGDTVYFLAGGGEQAHWVRNALAHPEVSVRLGGGVFAGTARVPTAASEEEHNARRLLAAKYQGWHEGRPLSRWAATAFCLAVDLTGRREDAHLPDPPWSLDAEH
jgi:deazaflavin-dependent oxidoreductase (nitroreductase family)